MAKIAENDEKNRDFLTGLDDVIRTNTKRLEPLVFDKKSNPPDSGQARIVPVMLRTAASGRAEGWW